MSKKSEMVENVNKIISQYGGMKLTIRQIYYRLVANFGLKNCLSSYQMVVKALVEARKDGRVNYSDIEDRTRAIHYGGLSETSSPAEYFRLYYDHMKKIDREYTLPRWFGQKVKVMVFVEKQALQALFEDVTDRLEVDLVVCRGYPSLTLMHDIAEHLDSQSDEIEEVEILYFGDFDPSGADIERHAAETLADEFGIEFNIQRIAITKDQIDELNIPPAPAKTSDARYEGFLAETGVAWQVELDAIEPKMLQQMLEKAIEQFFDVDIAERRDEIREARRAQIRGYMEGSLNPDFIPPERNEPAVDELDKPEDDDQSDDEEEDDDQSDDENDDDEEDQDDAGEDPDAS